MRRALARLASVGPTSGDAMLYGLGAAFALGIVLFSTLGLYRQWGELALGPYIFGTVVSAVLAIVRRHKATAGPPVATTTVTTTAAPPSPRRRAWRSPMTPRLIIAVCVPLALRRFRTANA